MEHGIDNQNKVMWGIIKADISNGCNEYYCFQGYA